MYTNEAPQFLKNKYKELAISTPEFHVVLGSGFGKALTQIDLGSDWRRKAEISFDKIPGLFTATVPGHHGSYCIVEHQPTRKSAIFQTGRLHGYEGLNSKDVVKTVMFTRLSGTPNYVLTNAAGSLTKDFTPGSVMIIKDHVNLTGQNPLAGINPSDANGKELGPRFPDMSQLYEKSWEKTLKESLESRKLTVNHGVYLGILGPSFETPAEIKLFGGLGLQAVGMSTVWEAIALKHSGAKLAGLSLISNYGCGLVDQVLKHEEILEMSAKAALQIVEGIFLFVSGEFKK